MTVLCSSITSSPRWFRYDWRKWSVTDWPAKLLGPGPSNPSYTQSGVRRSPSTTGRTKRRSVLAWKAPRPGQPNWMPENVQYGHVGGATSVPYGDRAAYSGSFHSGLTS